MNISLETQILRKIKKAGSGSLFFGDSFTALGNAKSVGKALERLVHTGELHRVATGIYVHPVKVNILGVVMPGIEDIAKAIAKSQMQIFTHLHCFIRIPYFFKKKGFVLQTTYAG